MNSIDDPRLEFYLKHQDLIQEWASVGDDVRDSVIKFYESLTTDLQVEAEAIGDQTVVVEKDGSWGHVGLSDFSWFLDDMPRAAIALEWQRASASFSGGRLDVGLRVDIDLPGGRDLRAAVADRVRSKRKDLGFPKSSTHWPAYTAVPGVTGSEYWKDLQPYRQQLTALVRSAWDALAEDVFMAISDSET